MKTPRFSLTHGQVLYALCRGLPPAAETIDRIRYLRRLGVPFTPAELGRGRGNRLRYSFEQLIELGVALFALGRGLAPRTAAEFLIGQRAELRKLYRKAFQDQPEAALEQPWVKSRGRIVPLLAEEVFLRLHDRYAEPQGTLDILQQAEVRELGDLVLLAERYPGEEARRLLPLTRLALELVAWAAEAPEKKPGPSRSGGA